MTETETRELIFKNTLDNIKELSELKIGGELVYKEFSVQLVVDSFTDVPPDWLICRLENHYQISLRPEPTHRPEEWREQLRD